jgi:hypothetical protein
VSLRPKPPKAWLIQKYIARPFLLDGRKFDIRALVVVTPNFQIFWYKQVNAGPDGTCSQLSDLLVQTGKCRP